MFQEKNKQNVEGIQFIDESKQQEENIQKAWKSYQFLVWLPVIFVIFLIFIESKSFLGTLFSTYPFLVLTLISISYYQKISKNTAIVLRRFGLAFLLGFMVILGYALSQMHNMGWGG